MLEADGLLDMASESERGNKEVEEVEECVCKHHQPEPGESERSCLYLYLRRAELKVLASLASTTSGLAESLGAERGGLDGGLDVWLSVCLRSCGERRGINQGSNTLERGSEGVQLAKSWQKLLQPTLPILPLLPILVWLDNLRMTG
jgi:hypothetical protein